MSEKKPNQRFHSLNAEQVEVLHQVLSEVVPIHGRGNFPTLELRPKDIIIAVRARLQSQGISVRDVRLNGSTASHVLIRDNCTPFKDLDIIFGVELPSQEEFQVIKESVLGCLLDCLPAGVNRERISNATMKEAYVQKMVKVFNEHDRWSLISLSNNTGKNLELKFVSVLRRQFEFSVDSFQIILDRLLESYILHEIQHRNSSTQKLDQIDNRKEQEPGKPKQEDSEEEKEKSDENDQVSDQTQSSDETEQSESQESSQETPKPEKEPSSEETERPAQVELRPEEPSYRHPAPEEPSDEQKALEGQCSVQVPLNLTEEPHCSDKEANISENLKEDQTRDEAVQCHQAPPPDTDVTRCDEERESGPETTEISALEENYAEDTQTIDLPSSSITSLLSDLSEDPEALSDPQDVPQTPNSLFPDVKTSSSGKVSERLSHMVVLKHSSPKPPRRMCRKVPAGSPPDSNPENDLICSSLDLNACSSNESDTFSDLKETQLVGLDPDPPNNHHADPDLSSKSSVDPDTLNDPDFPEDPDSLIDLNAPALSGLDLDSSVDPVDSVTPTDPKPSVDAGVTSDCQSDPDSPDSGLASDSQIPNVESTPILPQEPSSSEGPSSASWTLTPESQLSSPSDSGCLILQDSEDTSVPPSIGDPEYPTEEQPPNQNPPGICSSVTPTTGSHLEPPLLSLPLPCPSPPLASFSPTSSCLSSPPYLTPPMLSLSPPPPCLSPPLLCLTPPGESEDFAVSPDQTSILSEDTPPSTSNAITSREAHKASTHVPENLGTTEQRNAPLLPDSFPVVEVLAESMYGDFDTAMDHLRYRLIATRNPEEIRGGGLLKYSNLLVRDFRPASETEIKTLERYMCSRFFIDFPDVQEQQRKILSYLKNHFVGEERTKYQYLMTLRRVIDDSTVCLMGHERRQTLNMITVLALKVLGEQNIIPNTDHVTCFYQPAPYLAEHSAPYIPEPTYCSYFIPQGGSALLYQPYPLHLHSQTGLV